MTYLIYEYYRIMKFLYISTNKMIAGTSCSFTLKTALITRKNIFVHFIRSNVTETHGLLQNLMKIIK